MKYFENCTCIEELKKEYRKLALKHHPDIGGDTEIMKQINNQYETLFQKLKNIHKNLKNETYEAKTATSEQSGDFINIINQLINVKGIQLEIIGNWLWVTGETYIIKDLLKQLKFHWINNKKAWAFHKDEYVKCSKKELSLDDIRNLYGSAKVNKNSMPEALQA